MAVRTAFRNALNWGLSALLDTQKVWPTGEDARITDTTRSASTNKPIAFVMWAASRSSNVTTLLNGMKLNIDSVESPAAPSSDLEGSHTMSRMPSEFSQMTLTESGASCTKKALALAPLPNDVASSQRFARGLWGYLRKISRTVRSNFVVLICWSTPKTVSTVAGHLTVWTNG